jgi:hypothetical protein
MHRGYLLLFLVVSVVAVVIISLVPGAQSVEVIDFDGVTRDWDWLTGYFGSVQITSGSGAAGVYKVVAVSGPASLSIYVVDGEDNPVQDVPVIFHWADAPILPVAYRQCDLTKGIVEETETNGKVGFAMGGGSYYFPPDVGPHTVWVVNDGTDCFSGLGMVGLTEHDHIDSHWRLGPEVPKSFLFLPLVLRGYMND